MSNDMKKVNLMGMKPEHDLILGDRVSPLKKHSLDATETDKPVIDIAPSINRTSTDARAQARFLSMFK